MRAALSAFKRFSMIIGAPMRTNSRHRVRHDHPLVRLYLIPKRRGNYSRRKASPISLVSRTAILYEYYCSSLCKCTSHQLLIFAKAESLRSLLHQLEELLKGYSPMMNESTERVVETAIKYGAVFAEVCFFSWTLDRS